MARKQLKVKVDDSFLTTRRMWWSGFCLTDNATFALFNITANKLKTLGITKFEEFELSPETLDMAFDRTAFKPTTKVKEKKIIVDDKMHFDYMVYRWFKKTWPEMTVHKVTRFFSKEVKTLYVVLQKPMGRPVGILKAKKD